MLSTPINIYQKSDLQKIAKQGVKTTSDLSKTDKMSVKSTPESKPVNRVKPELKAESNQVKSESNRPNLIKLKPNNGQRIRENSRRILKYYSLNNNPKFRKTYIRKYKIDQLIKNNANQPCFIIGNGPNLTDRQLKLIENQMSIGCNYFYLGTKERKINFQPTILCSGDRTVTEHYLNDHYHLIKDQLVVMHPSFVINRKYPKDIHHTNNQQQKQLYHIQDFGTFELSPEITCREEVLNNIKVYCQFYRNVIPMIAMLIARQLGYRQIYLLGVDCQDIYQHFYTAKTSVSPSYPPEAYQRLYQGFKRRYRELQHEGIEVYINNTTSIFDFLPYYQIEGDTN